MLYSDFYEKHLWFFPNYLCLFIIFCEKSKMFKISKKANTFLLRRCLLAKKQTRLKKSKRVCQKANRWSLGCFRKTQVLKWKGQLSLGDHLFAFWQTRLLFWLRFAFLLANTSIRGKCLLFLEIFNFFLNTRNKHR